MLKVYVLCMRHQADVFLSYPPGNQTACLTSTVSRSRVKPFPRAYFHAPLTIISLFLNPPQVYPIELYTAEAEVTPRRIRGIFRGKSSHEEANVWAPSRSPTGRIFVGAGSNSGSHRMATVSPSRVDNGGSSNDSTPRSRDSQDGSVGRYYSESEGTDRRSRAVSSGIASIYIAGTSNGGSEGGGEVVFALARGVATVVTLSALALVMVLLIVAEAVLMLVAEKIGLAPVVILVLTIMFIAGRQMGVPFQSLARVLVFLWAF